MNTCAKTILLIDDSNFSRNFLKHALGNDYQFLEAANGLAGIELFANEKPDLVILDLTMPEMNGLEVLEKLRQLNQNARVIIGTADVQEFTFQQVMAAGAAGFIRKPFTPQQVQPIIQSLLGA